MQDIASAQVAYARILDRLEAHLLKSSLQEEDRLLLQQARRDLLGIDPNTTPKPRSRWQEFAAIGAACLLALIVGIIIGTLAGPQ